MPISHKHKIIFVHVPKAAGSSINKILECNSENEMFSYDWFRNLKNKPELPKNLSFEEIIKIQYCHPQHLKAHQLKLLFKNEWDNYYKFAIVRNPYDRFVSEYEYIKNHPVNKALDFKDLDFLAFTKAVCSLPTFTRQLIFDYHFDLQKDFLTSDNRIIVDEVYRFENLYPLFKRLKIMTGNDEVHELAYKTKDYKEYYCKESKYMVEKLFKDDLNYFSYSF